MNADVLTPEGPSPEDIQFIARCGVNRTYPRRAVIVTEGSETDSLYVIMEGRVKIYASEAAGKEIILNVQGPGEYFGELALLDAGQRSASVMTLEPVRLACVSRAAFSACIQQNPAVAFRLIRDLAQRVRVLTELVKNLALNDVYGRVARTLMNLAEEREGRLTIAERFTHQDIASMVGASREMVSHIMKDLTTGGYVEIKDRKFTIARPLPRAW
ncbi:MAG: Crp/Fnr family transcriptional regulator [Gammaproteobacteria bacterium]|nr:Crp/Fnr family transcriptional regulator [Gammaproteobacteria bacterium]